MSRGALVGWSVAVLGLLVGCTTAVPGAGSAGPGTSAPSAPTEGPAGFAGAPCRALSDAQVVELGLRLPGATAAEEVPAGLAVLAPATCTWYSEAGGTTLGLGPLPPPGSIRLDPGGPTVTIDIAGRQVSGSVVADQYCSMRFDLDDGIVLVSTFRDSPAAPGRGCDDAGALAEAVVTNLDAGGVAGSTGPALAPSEVERWAADPCAALSPSAVAAAAGPGATGVQEQGNRLRETCVWTGAAGTLRFVAVVVDTQYPPQQVEDRGRPGLVNGRPVVAVVEGTTCSLHARFGPGQLIVVAVDDPARGAETACDTAATAAAELFAI